MSPAFLPLLVIAFAQEPSPRPEGAPRAEQAARDDERPGRAEREGDEDRDVKGSKEKEKEKPEEPPVVTSHELRVGAKVLKYKVTTGFMPLKNEEGKTEARIFFMAYVAERPGGPSQRPLMFSFNGGPGSSSVWLHLGALGPRRVKMLQDGGLPAPPYELVDNEHTWLEFTDLVFIDPVGTGYSRAEKDGKKYWGVQGDIQSVGEFIRLYLTRHERWASPLFLVGESYGTTRAAGLSGHLVDRGIAFNGIVLVSSILNFQTARFTKGNDLPFVLFLPTYSATAWYHKRLPADLQARPLKDVLAEVERWAATEYQEQLARGDGLGADQRKAVIEKLTRYTGLDPEYLDNTDLRIEIQRFCKELLREEKRTVGRLDSRFKGMDLLAAAERPDFDPSMAAIRPPYTAMFNDYVRRSLGFKSDLTYHILGGGIGPWDWGSAGTGFADTSEALRSAFSKNPHMRLFVASGYYDLATPYFATEYTLRHLGLDPSLKGSIGTAYYEAGHMMYIHTGELARLRKDVGEFVSGALARK
jgi:carboxypeptidase C (cathepsin A)